MNEELNISIRRFLKQVGISSQKKIERALSASSDNTVKVTMTLTCEDSEDLFLVHNIEGHIGEQETA